MKLNGFTLDHTRLERLDTESVKCRCTVKEYRMTFHHVLEDIPDYSVFSVDNLLRRFNCLYDTTLDQFPDDKWFVKFSCHELRKTALMHLELRTNDDN